MTHHVVEYTAALLRALPEPRHVRTAMLFGSAREIRPPGERGASRPDQLLAARDIRSKELILHITGIESRTFCETRNRFCLGDISRERLLACETAQFPTAIANRSDDFFHVRDARRVWSTKPDGIDAWICDHVANRAVRFRVANSEPSRECRCCRSILRIRAPDSEHVCIANASEAHDVEARVESASNEANPQSAGVHSTAIRVFISSPVTPS